MIFDLILSPSGLDFSQLWEPKIYIFWSQGSTFEKNVICNKTLKNEKRYETLAMRSEIKGRRFPNQADIEDFQQTYLYKNRSQFQLRVLFDVGQF